MGENHAIADESRCLISAWPMDFIPLTSLKKRIHGEDAVSATLRRGAF
jgi:hypothetical protein